jgi:hypothetical protein
MFPRMSANCSALGNLRSFPITRTLRIDRAGLSAKESILQAHLENSAKSSDGIVESGSVNFIAVIGRPPQTVSFADVTDESFVPFRGGNAELHLWFGTDRFLMTA